MSNTTLVTSNGITVLTFDIHQTALLEKNWAALTKRTTQTAVFFSNLNTDINTLAKVNKRSMLTSDLCSDTAVTCGRTAVSSYDVFTEPKQIRPMEANHKEKPPTNIVQEMSYFSVPV